MAKFTDVIIVLLILLAVFLMVKTVLNVMGVPTGMP